MSMERHPFKISAYGAERVSQLLSMKRNNLGVDPEHVTPFQIAWSEREVPGHATRFRLPALLFEGTEVARLGYRGSEGFILIREELNDQTRHAIERRFAALEKLAKNNGRILSEERAYLHALIKERLSTQTANYAQRVENELPVIDVVNVMRRMFPVERLLITARGPKNATLAAHTPAFMLSEEFLEITDGRLVFAKDFVPSEAKKREIKTLTTRLLTDVERSEVNTAAYDAATVRNRDEQALESLIYKLKHNKSWTDLHNENGLSIHKENAVFLLRKGEVDVFSFRLVGGGLFGCEMSKSTGGDNAVFNGLTCLVKDMLLEHLAPAQKKDKVQKAPKSGWASRLNTVLQNEDPGYG